MLGSFSCSHMYMHKCMESGLGLYVKLSISLECTMSPVFAGAGYY